MRGVCLKLIPGRMSLMMFEETRRRLSIKKAGRIPMRVREGPAKNLLSRRQRNVQQETKTQWSLAGISNLIATKSNQNLAGFLELFAEITDVKNIEPWFELLAQLVTQYIPPLNKNQAISHSFLRISHPYFTLPSFPGQPMPRKFVSPRLTAASSASAAFP